jgi:hypothetical protein
MPEDGHNYTWGAPSGGWPQWCAFCGKRLAASGACHDCDSLLCQGEEPLDAPSVRS